MDQIDFKKYTNFVNAVTSKETNDIEEFVKRVKLLSVTTDVNISLLLNSVIGLAAEGGELAELPKKIVFQGKEITEDVIFHMKRELGDIIWYWTNACRALNLDPNDVIAENVHKLENRYPGGVFNPFYSENRQDGDL